jgi:hypothetical protein
MVQIRGTVPRYRTVVHPPGIDERFVNLRTSKPAEVAGDRPPGVRRALGPVLWNPLRLHRHAPPP